MSNGGKITTCFTSFQGHSSIHKDNKNRQVSSHRHLPNHLPCFRSTKRIEDLTNRASRGIV